MTITVRVIVGDSARSSAGPVPLREGPGRLRVQEAAGPSKAVPATAAGMGCNRAAGSSSADEVVGAAGSDEAGHRGPDKKREAGLAGPDPRGPYREVRCGSSTSTDHCLRPPSLSSQGGGRKRRGAPTTNTP